MRKKKQRWIKLIKRIFKTLKKTKNNRRSYTELKHLTNRARSSIEFPKFRKWNSVFITQTRTTLHEFTCSQSIFGFRGCFRPRLAMLLHGKLAISLRIVCRVIRVDGNGPAEMKEFHRNDVVNLVNTKRGRREIFRGGGVVVMDCSRWGSNERRGRRARGVRSREPCREQNTPTTHVHVQPFTCA